MPDPFFTLDDFDLRGRTVLVRVDINSPLDPLSGRILNDARLRQHLATLRDLRDAKVAVMAHQSRPGKADFTTLQPHAERMAYLLGKTVRYVDSLFGRAAVEAIESMRAGDVVVLENTRFYSEEQVLANRGYEAMANTHIVRRLAPLADFFVLDAFAAAHRAQPTLCGFCEVLPTLAGRVMERELRMLAKAVQGEDRPKVAVFGGIKVDDTLAVMEHMLAKDIVDGILTAGAVASVFLAAKGIALGKGTEEVLRREVDGWEELVGVAAKLLDRFEERIDVPTDVVVNDEGRRRPLLVADLPAEPPIYDIGLDTIARYIGAIRAAKTVIVNGPAGVFEIETFSVGTRELFTAVANADAFAVAGGGHTVAAMERLGLASRIDHVSTGGGALIHYLAGRPLPLLDALRRSRERFGHLLEA
jgi:phosphoglycerate kinase